MTVYIDIDETLYNLSKLVIETANREFNTNYDYVQNTNWWWEDYITETGCGSREYFEELLQVQGVFLYGGPIENAIETVNKLYNEGFNIKFLSCPQWNKYCTYEKVTWLSHCFEWFNADKHLILTGDKSIFDRVGDVLIDDAIHNLTWTKGINIAFNQKWNEKYKGLRMNWNEIYNFLWRKYRCY
jgi:5'(3')-deoxyribonucleotidase|uniref:5' nucleotidase n=1 Tax=Siphoviridae sp. cteLh2 TaxID=2825590 RepID=A0A8S5U5N8_9CAUD|nr:hypothetical protein [uncultured Lachnoclostridium sp.]DAF89764.1 MAG TPA: 5' nucleotidase [Siphoviridae sp. cteLh2]